MLTWGCEGCEGRGPLLHDEHHLSAQKMSKDGNVAKGRRTSLGSFKKEYVSSFVFFSALTFWARCSAAVSMKLVEDPADAAPALGFAGGRDGVWQVEHNYYTTRHKWDSTSLPFCFSSWDGPHPTLKHHRPRTRP